MDADYMLKEIERVSKSVKLVSKRSRDPAKRWVCTVERKASGVDAFVKLPYYGGTPTAAITRAYNSTFA